MPVSLKCIHVHQSSEYGRALCALGVRNFVTCDLTMQYCGVRWSALRHIADRSWLRVTLAWSACLCLPPRFWVDPVGIGTGTSPSTTASRPAGHCGTGVGTGAGAAIALVFGTATATVVGWGRLVCTGVGMELVRHWSGCFATGEHSAGAGPRQWSVPIPQSVELGHVALGVVLAPLHLGGTIVLAVAVVVLRRVRLVVVLLVVLRSAIHLLGGELAEVPLALQ